MEVEVSDGLLTVRGNTYRFKDQLKRLGFEWDWKRKLWVSQDASPALQRVVKDMLGATTATGRKVSTTTADSFKSRISYGTYENRLLRAEQPQPRSGIRVHYEDDDEDDDGNMVDERRRVVPVVAAARVKRHPPPPPPRRRMSLFDRDPDDEEVANYVLPCQVEVYSMGDDVVSSTYDNDYVDT